MKNKKNLLISLPIILAISYFLLNSLIGNDNLGGIKNLFNKEQVKKIKEIFFPYKVISQQKKLLLEQNELLEAYTPKLEEELQFRSSLNDVKIFSEESINLNQKLKMKKLKRFKGFYAGIWNHFPGTGFIDFHNDNIIVISSRGIVSFKNIFDDKNFLKQIQNNIDEYININQFSKKTWYSLKDISIINNYIYISYTEEIKEDCWNTSIINAKMNYENIKFKKLFSSDQCVHSTDNIDNEFTASQSGGRIINYDTDHIIVSIGDYRERHLAQDQNSINGKILKINKNDSSYEIISMGHRNPQGLYFDREENFILETEHGPKGGDEINLIELNQSKIPNYGWAIASYGEHYTSTDEKYERYPLYKSHSNHGFIEPLKSFTSSLGISEIIKIKKKSYVVSSLKDKSLYFFNLDDSKKIDKIERVEVFERVRDIAFKNNKIYMFLEDTASIGIIDISVK